MASRPPQYDKEFLRGDFDLGRDDAFAERARAHAAIMAEDNMRRIKPMFVFDPDKLANDDIRRTVAEIAGIPLAQLTNERLKRAIDIVEQRPLRKPPPPCGCRACVQARAELARREENELKAAITAEAMRILGAPRCGCTRDMLCKACADKRWTPKPPVAAAPVSVRVNRCDCPGCQPSKPAQVSDPPHALARALRFGGWRTSDSKRIGAGQYVRDHDV